jgi:hypothetical protein
VLLARHQRNGNAKPLEVKAREHVHDALHILTAFPPPCPCSQHGFLFDLPLTALYAILHKAGPRARELCKAFMRVYGPLPRLTPRGLATPDELVAALATRDNRYLQLSALDLSCAKKIVMEDSLLALCKALPNLRELRLHSSDSPYGCTIPTAASVAAAISQLPNLTTLHIPFLSGMDNDPLPEWPFSGCTNLQELTLPGSFVTSPSSTALSCFPRLSKLSFEAYDIVGSAHIASLAAQLPALVALQLDGALDVGAVAQLRSLTQLTGLTMSVWYLAEQGVMTGPLLQHVGSLTNLRSLALRLDFDQDTAAPGWLTRLTLLTRLRLDLDERTREAGLDGLNAAFADAASSVPHLPALHQLHLGKCDGTPTVVLPAAACAHLASARAHLGLLHLQRMELPACFFAEVLPQLTGLTCLRLVYVITPFNPDIMSFSWLAGLTALRELSCEGNIGDHADWAARRCGVLPCKLLAGLSKVDTLSLESCDFVDGPYLAQLCESMPQLQSLNLSHDFADVDMGAGLPALQHLTNLEVLALPCFSECGEHVKAPPSLRRCYLGLGRQPDDEAHAKAVLGRHVEVVFSYLDQGWRII